MKQYQYRITVEYIANSGNLVSSTSLQFGALPNHGDVFAIIDFIGDRHNLLSETATRFATSLKLITEIMLENRTLPLLPVLKPHVGKMMKIIKNDA